MRNKKIILFINIVIILLLIICKLILNNSKYYVNEVNQYLDAGGFKLLTNELDMKEMLEQNFKRHPGFGVTGYSSDKEGIIVEFTGYPSMAKGSVLTKMEITNPEYSFCDMHVGDNIDEAIKILHKHGFMRYNFLNSASVNRYDYIKGKIIVNLYVNDKFKITTIDIHLKPRKTNVMY